MAAAAAYRLPAWLRGDVDGIVADLLALVAPKLRRVAALPREAHWHAADAELVVYRMTVQEVGIIRRSPRRLAEQARLVDALLAGAQAAVEQIRMQARAGYETACAAELVGESPGWEDALTAGVPAPEPNPHWHCSSGDSRPCPTGEHVNPDPAHVGAAEPVGDASAAETGALS
jgi:hypothetical protein